MEDRVINIQSDDNELVESFIKGNDKSFNLIVLKYQKMIYNISRKMVLEHHDADDITQEVFIRLYNNIRQFRRESSLSTYLYRIAINLCINHLNKFNKILKRKLNINGLEDKFISYDRTFDEDTAENEKAKMIQKAIKSLPPKQRAVFNLKFYDNFKYEEISEILGKSTGGVKANYFHAIKKIKNYIRKNYPDFKN